MEQLRVTELPSLIMVTLHPTFESGKFAGAQAKSHPYKGPIKYHSMHSWMDNMISTLDQISGGKFRGKKAHQSPEKAMAQLVPAVSSAASLVEHCTSKGGICVLALVDASVEKHEQVNKVRRLHRGPGAHSTVGFAYALVHSESAFLILISE